MVARGYARSTASAARTLLTTILGDAIPRHLQTNPAARRRGKGRRGQRRIEQMERAKKVWATPLQALLIAERCAVLSGQDVDFVTMILAAYTGMRWSEINGLSPACVHGDALDVHWKLYELDGSFYRGRPKDGSARTIDLPRFLGTLLTNRLKTAPTLRCTCSDSGPSHDGIDWCDGTDEYTLLGPRGGHRRRSTYARRILGPAADGWYPAAGDRPAMPVLVDATRLPGTPMTPWPAAEPGQPFAPPRGRGRRPVPDETPVASWLPILANLTAHGFRHGHQTWMDDAGIPYVLQAERMGHEVPGMRGVYTHVSDEARERLKVTLETLWVASLTARAQIHLRSAVPVLDELLARHRLPPRSTPNPLPESDM